MNATNHFSPEQYPTPAELTGISVVAEAIKTAAQRGDDMKTAAEQAAAAWQAGLQALRATSA